MSRLDWWTTGVLVLLAGVFLHASQSEGARRFSLRVQARDYMSQPATLVATEGEAAELTLDAAGTYSFVPRMRTADSTTVTVDIFEGSVEDDMPLGSVAVEIGGDAVASTTRPVFVIAVPRARGGEP